MSCQEDHSAEQKGTNEGCPHTAAWRAPLLMCSRAEGWAPSQPAVLPLRLSPWASLLSLMKRLSRRPKSHFPKGPKSQVAGSNLQSFRGSGSFSYRSRAIWFKIPIKAAMLISYIGSYFLIIVPKENLGRERERLAPQPSFVHLNKA